MQRAFPPSFSFLLWEKLCGDQAQGTALIRLSRTLAVRCFLNTQARDVQSSLVDVAKFFTGEVSCALV